MLRNSQGASPRASAPCVLASALPAASRGAPGHRCRPASHARPTRAGLRHLGLNPTVNPADRSGQGRAVAAARGGGMGAPERCFDFAIDRGGTFTDVFAEVPDGEGGTQIRALKLLSEDPAHYKDAPREGIRRILEEVTGVPHPRDRPLDTSRIRSIRMGTTVATNALLERKGERMALVVTKGFRDLLHIGNQSRPNIFDLEIRCPEVLYECVVEVEEQVVLTTWLAKAKGWKLENSGEIEGATGEKGLIRIPLDEANIKKQLQGVLDKGISSIAVVLKHAAIFPQHEQRIGQIARAMGFTQVSLSHEAMQMVKMVPRGFTAAADAYLTPHIKRYISTFCSGFDDGLQTDVRVLFMQSDGGLAQIGDFSGHKAILSGPAGGYVGYAVATHWEGVEKESLQIIGFDMGGTSTDVSRYDGTYSHVFESVTAGVTIQAPQLDINTVAAGGGSRLFFRRGMFVVGPESAGAHPGPVCYRKGGPLTITDANLALGRIVPDHFPKIFGPNEDEALDVEGANAAMSAMAQEVNDHASAHGQSQKSKDEVAMGFIRVANEAMCRPIRALTQMKGYDIQQHVLTCFGGAGGQHACSIARSLGIRTVFIHRYSSILSAVGMGVADVVHEAQRPYKGVLGSHDADAEKELDVLERTASQALQDQGFKPSQVLCKRFLNLRYDGTDVAMMTSCEPEGSYRGAFLARYRREFGFVLDRDILIDDVRVRGTGTARPLVRESRPIDDPGPLPPPASVSSAFFEPDGRQPTPTFLTGHLSPGHKVPGPALLLDDISTVVVEPGCVALVTGEGNIVVEVNPEDSRHQDVGEDCDPIQLAIFSHRFMSIAEQMGRALQRTSISVNIKERLDFSCALFDATGSLVANAPHLPVHLGAMSEAIKFQVEYYGPDGEGASVGLKDGDVLMSNHPQLAGGSHLPDITVITPVFSGGRVVFFVASRGHHADIGGISPGSMPPHSKSLLDEGASIVTFKLVEDDVFQEAGVTELLMAPGSSGRPGVSGTRALSDNLSDLRAQVAANTQGIRLIKQLIESYGLGVVQAYMGHIQRNAEDSVRAMLREFAASQGLGEVGSVEAEDRMDDGTPIKLTVTVDAREGSAVFDFEGTGPEVYGNCNAPAAVTSSAVIYAMRCLVRQDIPLNQGCLAPITIRIPAGTILSPSSEAAVCGGNVLTSQRVTDVVLKAFRAAAASQGCMNNFTFGDDSMGYYETIAGGAGAGPGWHGRSGVHTHMTNTRITDPEIFERRYPVVLTEFSLREGSGGSGQWRGGDGVVREVEFLAPLTASILSERRSTEPFGLLGGKAGAAGVNLLKRRNGHTVSLGGKASVEVHPGDRIRILTPGGGGFGAEAGANGAAAPHAEERGFAMPGGEGGEFSRQSGSVLEHKRLQESA